MEQQPAMNAHSKQDAFPPTAHTWLGQRLESGEVGPAREHVMAVYFGPLTIYIKGSSFRRLGDPQELVAGFFSDRLAREDYLDRWLSSDLPLRVWLIKGLRFYLQEYIRAEKRHAGQLPADVDDAADAPGSQFRQTVAHNMMREAVRATSTALQDEGLGEHWDVFRLHHLEGMPYARIADLKNLTEERAAVMARTAARRLRNTTRQLCAWPGATTAQIDAELMAMFD
ncbi:MAG: hypothetical protein AAFX05_13590 [Planctomycetota bacterium]